MSTITALTMVEFQTPKPLLRRSPNTTALAKPQLLCLVKAQHHCSGRALTQLLLTKLTNY